MPNHQKIKHYECCFILRISLFVEFELSYKGYYIKSTLTLLDPNNVLTLKERLRSQIEFFLVFIVGVSISS